MWSSAATEQLAHPKRERTHQDPIGYLDARRCCGAVRPWGIDKGSKKSPARRGAEDMRGHTSELEILSTSTISHRSLLFLSVLSQKASCIRSLMRSWHLV